MSSFRNFLTEWNAKQPRPALSPLAFANLCADIEAMDPYDKIHLMDLEDHVDNLITNAIYEVEAGEDM